MKFILSTILSLFLFVGSIHAIWQRNIVNYEKSTYQAGFQNWMIAQDKNGWMYFGNTKGLLEFDGVYWNLYSAKNKIVRSVNIIDDRIYVGASSEFGFFEKDEIGRLQYHSLSDSLPPWGGDIWSVTIIDDKIYFLADNIIFVYIPSTGQTTSISTDVKIDYCSTSINKRLYLATTDGLFYLNDSDALVFEESSKPIVGEKIVGLKEYNNQMLVTTARAGIFLIDDSNCRKIQSKADDFIVRNQLFCSRLIGSKMVLGSVQNGAFIFDLNDPSYKEEFNISNGLKNNTVLSILFDREGNLWLGLDKGIGYINLNSPIRPLFPVNSPMGTGYRSVLYNNELYLGTNQGLYVLDKNGSYEMVKGSEGQIWSLDIIDNSLFVSGDNETMVISPQGTYKIHVTGSWGVEQLASDENMLIAGTYSGFRFIDKIDGKWSNVRTVKGFAHSCRGFLEDETDNVFWMANANGNVERVTINPKTAEILNQKTYTLGDGNMGENTFFRKIYNNIVVCSNKGIYQYSRISDEFTPYPQLETILDGQMYYDFLDSDPAGNIWFVSDKRLKMIPYKDGNFVSHIIDWGVNNELIDNYESVTLLNSNSAIVSVDKAFLKIDLTKAYDKDKTVDAFIRKLVTTNNDSIVNYNNADMMPEIPYSRNSINIYFAATEYSQSADVLYSYRLKGQDTKWSTPSVKTMKEYTNLYEGKYTFEVKAFINGYEDEGNIASMTFDILPPWYRNNWAYLIYTILFLATMFVLYKKTIKKQRLIIEQKGKEMEDQTKQYEQERSLKDKEIYELQNENLKTNLSYKTQELTGYILNVIRKNEILEDVKKEVLSISKSLEENRQPSVIKQKVIKLTTQINNNIEQDKDFEIFQSNFNLIHKDFFKLLDEKFPRLTRNDKILCAYLKMDLSSKEIAPLQNISVRGVEVNRYRLRKKMNLDREINLTEFIQNLPHVIVYSD